MKSATNLFASTLGAFMALGGVEHGIGEILQGSAVPAGVMIQSWPDAEFFRSVSGEPAMTVIPNLLATGVLAVLVSLVLLVWCVRFIGRRDGGPVMILLSAAMLLVGGGIFPPILCALLGGAVALGRGRRARPATAARRFLAGLWPWSFAACMLSWLAMLPGVSILSTFFGVENDALTLSIGCVALATLLSTLLTGFARDSLR